MKTIHDIEHLEGVKVLVRVDYNVPIQNGVVVDDFRIRSSLDTIRFLVKGGAKIILISHLEAVDGSNPSLEPVAACLNTLGIKTSFAQLKDAYTRIEHTLHSGECLLIENIRTYEEEKKNDKAFSKQLASLADLYVNDAFSVCHREHASVVGIPAYIPSYAGIQLNKEVMNLSRAFEPSHPFVFIIGGAKFETKLPIIERFSHLVDTICIGGALANDVLKARGLSIGASKTSANSSDIRAIADDAKVIVPVDVVVQDHIEKDADKVAQEDKILDAGKKTVALLKERIDGARFVLWNGPLGLYEDGYQGATLDVARIIAERGLKKDGFVSIVGGGDTVAAIATLGLEHAFTFISTGGGAMLDFLAKGTLPGIEALK